MRVSSRGTHQQENAPRATAESPKGHRPLVERPLLLVQDRLADRVWYSPRAAPLQDASPRFKPTTLAFVAGRGSSGVNLRLFTFKSVPLGLRDAMSRHVPGDTAFCCRRSVSICGPLTIC